MTRRSPFQAALDWAHLIVILGVGLLIWALNLDGHRGQV